MNVFYNINLGKERSLKFVFICRVIYNIFLKKFKRG